MISARLASIGPRCVARRRSAGPHPHKLQAPRYLEVSAAGSDSRRPCSFAAPCRHFQAAVMATSAGGEVDALDPAGYGPIVINQAITIEGQGWSYIAPPTGGNGITINAGSGNVAIHGVSLNGAGITGPTNGIVFNSGGSLTVTDCVAQNFVSSGGLITTGNGILMQPPAGTIIFAITNTTVANNGTAGFLYDAPPGSTATVGGTIDRVVATNNGSGGIAINVGNGGAATTFSITTNTTANDNSTGINLATASNLQRGQLTTAPPITTASTAFLRLG